MPNQIPSWPQWPGPCAATSRPLVHKLCPPSHLLPAMCCTDRKWFATPKVLLAIAALGEKEDRRGWSLRPFPSHPTVPPLSLEKTRLGIRSFTTLPILLFAFQSPLLTPLFTPSSSDQKFSAGWGRSLMSGVAETCGALLHTKMDR